MKCWICEMHQRISNWWCQQTDMKETVHNWLTEPMSIKMHWHYMTESMNQWPMNQSTKGTNKPMNQHKSTNQESINRWSSESTNQCMDRSINESIIHSINESIYPPPNSINESIYPPPKGGGTPCNWNISSGTPPFRFTTLCAHQLLRKQHPL